ncbi:class I tRNA ligase family protein [Candidatus Kaiserbacteria bacterium]|nr:MAG: class I tRNA ligase family protein [Candidatus Kaiserbacteria bacterium]
MEKKIENRKNTPTVQTEKSDVALREEEILAFWRENEIFNKSVETPAGREGALEHYVFYDGPPFATGTPHYGHILAGTIKDAIPRFQTMNGKRVIRKWGWDCHGLPLENIIEKRLGLSTKRDIEEMGVKQFNEAARDAVLEYADDWKEVVPRMGRFVDMEDDYRTMDATYTESVWWVFSELNKKGLVYEGFKTMHLCPRCGTTLSNFEVNQGYKDIKDIAVTVKMPLLDEQGNVTDTSILIWTTTPWTLPGNLAVAVNRDIEYVKVQVTLDGTEEKVILAKARLAQLSTDEYEILEEMKGEALLGRKYLPPFDSFLKQEFVGKEKAWTIYHADYVEVGEEGTGAVHIAPAYGDDDMELAKREGVPVMHHVDVDGHFKECVTHFAGQLVKPKDDDKADVSHLDADIEVVKYLKDAHLLVRKENITHSYPHCWRCDTPLLNYATTSWFVRVTDIKDALVSENAKVHWVPEHVGTNRFGKWLEGARDWAVSRQRYWGAPIPIWKNVKTGVYKVFGSLAELKTYIPKSGNTYFLTRHGESEFNPQFILNGLPGIKNGLTEKGKAQVDATVEALRGTQIDLIYYSPLERTIATAMRIREELGVPMEACFEDDRIKEMQFGEFEGKQVYEYHAFFGAGYNRLVMCPEGGESWTDVKKRVGEFLYEIEKKHSGKKILIVSHNGALQMLQAAAHGDEHKHLGEIIETDEYDMHNAEVRALDFTPLPHNDTYVLDFHRPYIDEIELVDTDGERMVRVPDVFDCWFESGSMPYAQNHYPFENLESFNAEKSIGFPAQFIAEGLDQTRGWFYSLLVLGVALFGKSPFESVIVNGLTLAEDGKKMSKSLQNYPDPMELANRVGVDALRYYLLSSPVVHGEDLSVSEKEILELQRKNIGRLHNVLAMYETYQNDAPAQEISTNILDMWIIARLNETVRDITAGYASYELDKATRPIEGLIDDLSVWYLRRSRERLKGEDMHDKARALATLRYVLKNLALLMAPVMPFYAEYLFLRVREEGEAESVHLMSWPKGGEVDINLLSQMSLTRQIVTIGLEARAKANIKVRQPLPRIDVSELPKEEFISLILEEINVKTIGVFMEATLSGSGSLSGILDTTITPALKQEGNVRELMRAIQEARKTAGLEPNDRIVLWVSAPTKELIAPFEIEMLRTVGAREARIDESGATQTLILEGVGYRFGITVA